MGRIMSIYKKIRKDNRLTTVTVAVLGACLLAVVVLFFTMPEIQAATTNTVTWTESAANEYQLSSLQNGDASTITATTIDAVAGGVYTIDGTGVQKTNVNITISYGGTTGTDAAPAKVYVNLINVDIQQTLDASALRFATNGYPVDFVVTVQGECSVVSTCQGAYYPLIAVEDTSYTLYRLKKPTGDPSTFTVESYVTSETVSKQVSLILEGATPTSVLNLSNGAGSYGALIGSGEATKFTTESMKEINALITKLNSQVLSEGQITVANTSIDAKLKAEPYKFTNFNNIPGQFQPQYKYKSTSGTAAGSVIIGGENGTAPLVLNMKNSGYGAAIGGGGNELSTGKGADAGRVTINAGTVTFNSPAAYLGSPIFGSGIAKGAANPEATYGYTGGVEINGGSVSLGNYENKFGNSIPVNKNGDRVYQVQANTKNDTTGLSIVDLAQFNDGDALELKYIYDTSLQFDVDINRMTTSVVKNTGTQNILDVDIILSPTLGYAYDGTGHGDKYVLNFWLPAIQTTTFTITDEFGPGQTEFTLKDSGGVIVEPISDDVNSADNRRYVLVRGETYYLVATNIPSGLRIRNVQLTAGGNTTNANYNAAYGYQINASDVSVQAVVSYSGSIEIVYNDGLLSEDRGSHDLVMPVSKYEYGTESYELPKLGTIYKDSEVGGQVEDIIFKDWIYTDASGNELGYITHITKNPSLDGNKKTFSEVVQPDGKIYVKAVWSVKVKYVIGDDATVSGNINEVVVEYGYGTGNVMDVTITSKIPVKDEFAFMGWSLDDDDELYNYSTSLGAINTVSVSTLTSHVFYANYERTGFSVYIDASKLNEDYAELSCIGSTGADILKKAVDGSLATVVIDGKTYYYTNIVKKDSTVRVIIQTKHGYKIENCSVRVTGSASNSVVTDGITGQCIADIILGDADVYVSTDATFSPVEYEIFFKDGKQPNEVLWNGYKFSYNIEDIADNKTIGDVIRKGLGVTVADMSDAAISAYINTIDKNTRFTDFSGWGLPFYSEALPMDKTIASIFEENASIQYGDIVFTANWTEYDKFIIDVSLFERENYTDGSFRDRPTDKLTPVLYYYADGNIKVPIYTEEIIDSETGEERTVAYAKAGDKIEIALHRMNSKGKPIGEPVVEGINIEQLYYLYESKANESVRADVMDGSQSFTVKDDVKDDTVIEVYMAFTLKKYNIVYWDVRGFDNSANPTTYTIFDEIEFVPLADGVDWLLVCPDTDDTNNDDVTTEVIYRIEQDGKLVTDGIAGERDYLSNLILKPDWSLYKEDSYNIDIRVDNTAFGQVSIIYPTDVGEDGFFANDMIILSVVPREGYKLVDGSLVYRKEMTPSLMFRSRTALISRIADTYAILPVNEAEGTYLFTMPNSNIVITAEFELCQYNIIYSDIAEGVINTNPDSYNINSEIVLADATRDGYKFLGWYDADGNKIAKITGRTGDIVLTPMFELIEDVEKPDGGDLNPDDGDTNQGDGNVKPDDGSTKPGGNSGNQGNGTTKPDDGNTQKPSDGNNGNSSSVTITGRPSNVVSRPSSVTINNSTGAGSGPQTGDETNVPRLILICVAAVLLLMIVVIKKPKDKDDEN